MKTAAKAWRDAATLILAARTGPSNCFKLLMLKRSSKSTFMPNAYVFPGGVASTVDFYKEWHEIFARIDNGKFTRLKDLQSNSRKPLIYTKPTTGGFLPPELGFRICAIRETFEESGLLLIKSSESECKILDDPDLHIGGKYGKLGNWRDKTNEDPNNFLELFRTFRGAPDILSLYDWSTWITPWIYRSRFNTIFYICFLDRIPAYVDSCEQEVTETKWFTNDLDCLEKINKLPPPQQYEYSRFSRFKTFGEFKSFSQQRESLGLETWCPHKISLQDGYLITYPGDDYHNPDPLAKSSSLDTTLNELKLRSEHMNRFEVARDKRLMLVNNVGWCGHPSLGEFQLQL